MLNCRDVSERKAFEEQLTHQAFHDPVTGLANRALFAERVRHAIARSRREHNRHRRRLPRPRRLQDHQRQPRSCRRRRGARRGREAPGDERPRERHRRALRWRRVRAAARGHRGRRRRRPTRPNEFSSALAVPLRVGHKETVAAVQHRYLGRLRGCACRAEELIRDADAAMYRAKRDGKGSYRLFEPEMHQGVLARLELRTDLQRAIATRAARAALPAGRPTGRRRHLRRRGAAPLAPPGARDDPARRLHPAGRGDGADHPDRQVGAA